MGPDHEYALLHGVSRAVVARTLAFLAMLIASLLVALALAAVHFAESIGLMSGAPRVLVWPLTATVIWGLLYAVFDRYVWRIPFLLRWMKLPDLRGEWDCIGRTINPDQTPSYCWEGVVTITQSWDRIKVRLRTAQSRSSSVSAAIAAEETGEYRLLYHYVNDPRSDSTDLSAHRGFADILVAADGTSAEGEYFNGRGRFTFGTMTWQRRM